MSRKHVLSISHRPNLRTREPFHFTFSPGRRSSKTARKAGTLVTLLRLTAKLEVLGTEFDSRLFHMSEAIIMIQPLRYPRLGISLSCWKLSWQPRSYLMVDIIIWLPAAPLTGTCDMCTSITLIYGLLLHRISVGQLRNNNQALTFNL